MSQPNASDHFESLFEYAPISLWEEDYSGIKIFFDELRANGVTDLDQYLHEHPDEINKNMARIKVNHVNRETLNMFGAESETELLANLDRIFRDEMRVHFRSELTALWNGEVSWSGDGINYWLDGEALDIRLHWRILVMVDTRRQFRSTAVHCGSTHATPLRYASWRQATPSRRSRTRPRS